MDLIREPRPGETLNWAWGAKVVRALRRMELRGGPGVRVSSGPNGTTVAAAAAAAADSVSYPFPFRVSLATNPEDEDEWLVRVNDGFVNGVPAMIDGVPLYASPAPSLLLAKDTASSLYLEVIPDSAFLPDTVELYLGTRPADVLDFTTPENSRFRFSLALISAAGVPTSTVGNNLAYAMTSLGPAWSGV